MTDFNVRLNTLYNQRPALSQNEWAELYSLIQTILKPSKLWFSNDSAWGQEDGINGFFVDKIMTTTSVNTECSPSMIRTMFSNYAIDLNKTPRNLKAESLDDDSHSEVEEEKQFDFSTDHLEETLSQHNLTATQTRQAAHDFYQQLKPAEQLMIARNLCPDADQALPLTTLQQQYDKKASHYNAKKLGVLHRDLDCPTDYEDTVLGRWLKTTFAIDFQNSHRSLIAIILQILCVVALTEADV